MGGYLINYPDDCGTPTADLLTVKLLFNSIISTPNCKFMTIDIKDFYLMNPMDRYEYFRMKLELFPPEPIGVKLLRVFWPTQACIIPDAMLWGNPTTPPPDVCSNIRFLHLLEVPELNRYRHSEGQTDGRTLLKSLLIYKIITLSILLARDLRIP